MTLTFNPDKYKELLTQYQPKLIKTETENDRALAIVEELMHRQDRTPEEDELYQLLIVLIERFEQEYYAPGQASTPRSMLAFLMEQRNLEVIDLASVLGSTHTVTEILDGDRSINSMEAQALSQFFHVNPALFTSSNNLAS